MRDKQVLLQGFEDIKILQQYLYMDGEHSVTIAGAACRLRISMDGSAHYRCTNLEFPEAPPMQWDGRMDIPYMLGIIAQLKESVPDMDVSGFKSRWDEICKTTLANVALNQSY